ncbi:MAG: hypothetical protein ACI9WU_004238 [Myxococcota bacterium]|jgi:hypothetical protein
MLLALLNGGNNPPNQPIWSPGPGVTWHWQLEGGVDYSRAVGAYNIDLFETPRSRIQSLQARGVRVICYLSAGSHEKGRPDSGELPATVIGSALPGYPDEHWLNIREGSVRRLMARRLALAAWKGCDAVELDNMQTWLEEPTHPSGFGITAVDQLDYALYLADTAHWLGLTPILKNNLPQIPALLDDFEIFLVEECFQYDECDPLDQVVAAGKAALVTEYALPTGKFCPEATKRGFSAMRKRPRLDAWSQDCW